MRRGAGWRAVLVCAIALSAPRLVHAQAAPPMITNDPGTPGGAKWEIDLGSSGGGAHGRWDVAAPDVGINFGVGEHIQLSVNGSWAHARDDAGPWRSDWGDAELGVRWRFLDQDKAGVDVAVQPAWTNDWSASARRRGLGSEHASWFVPVQAMHDFGTFIGGVEVGRHFVAVAPDAWQGGVFVAHTCLSTGSCIAEVNITQVDGEAAVPTFNIGTRAPLGDGLNLLASVGSELRGEDRQLVIFYLGLQILR